MADNIKTREGMSLIDCAMIVIKPDDGSEGIAFTSASKLGVEKQEETNEAVKNIIKNAVKAQKPEETTLTGHTLTLTDTTLIMEALPILQGGTLTKDNDGNITGYTPPVSGKNEGKVFTLEAYTASMEGSTITGYACMSYPGCKGTPVVMNFEDNVFQSNEYTINSTPGKGQPPYSWKRVDALPTYANPNVPLGALTVTSAAGATTGKTKVTVTPAKSGGNVYKYQTGRTVTLPLYNETLASGWTDWDGTADITATTGNQIAVVECTADGLAVSGGTATVTSKAEAPAT